MKSILFFSAFIILLSCNKSTETISDAPVPDSEDIVFDSYRNYEGGIEGNRRRKYINLNLLDSIKLGETTEKELYDLYSREIDIRLSFNPVMPRRHFGVYKPVDRKVVYDGAKITVQKIEGGLQYTADSIVVAIFYLYKGVVQFYSVGTDYRDPNLGRFEVPEKTTKDFLICKRKFPGDSCLENKCERKYYELKILKWPLESHLKGHFITAHDIVCDFEKPGFESTLKKSGYYKLLEDIHYGKKFPRPRFGNL
ncbi:hypothetical protein P3G55_04500 [Leptospira sp. 96542]|nr:hypothetical protein [Leptospira sp. 96542]